MYKTLKRSRLIVAVTLLIAIVAAFFAYAPVTARANAALPFELTAPSNVVLTKDNIGDSSTTLGMAYNMSNEINAFFNAYDAYGDGAAYLASLGITAYDEIRIGVQIDWALDDVNDEVSGWHHNEYWDSAPLSGLGQDENGVYHYSEWDIVDCWIYSDRITNDIWLYRGMNLYGWLGDENSVGVKDQLRPSQYTVVEQDEDIDLNIDWNAHTMYSRARFVITTFNSETFVTEYTFSDWSETVAYGKDAVQQEPVKKSDVPAPVITGLRLTDEKFNDNPVVAFTLTVPAEVTAANARVQAKLGTLRIEVEARRKGTTEWINLNVASDITTGEHKADLVYLVEEGQIFPEGTEVELRARYYCAQPGQDDFYSDYSKIIGFGSDEIADTSAPGSQGAGSNDGESGSNKADETKTSCKLCHKCSQPLGICIYIWIIIAVIVVAVAAGVIVILKKLKNKDRDDRDE